MVQENPDLDKRTIEKRLKVQWRYLSKSTKQPYLEEAEKKVKANLNKAPLKATKVNEKLNGVDRVTKVKPVSPGWMTNEENKRDLDNSKGVMVECDMCNRSMSTEEFEKHWREVHSTKEVSSGPASNCSICDKVLAKDEYLTHFKVRIN